LLIILLLLTPNNFPTFTATCIWLRLRDTSSLTFSVLVSQKVIASRRIVRIHVYINEYDFVSLLLSLMK